MPFWFSEQVCITAGSIPPPLVTVTRCQFSGFPFRAGLPASRVRGLLLECLPPSGRTIGQTPQKGHGTRQPDRKDIRPPSGQNDRQVLKHYLPVTSLVIIAFPLHEQKRYLADLLKTESNPVGGGGCSVVDRRRR